MKNPKKKMANDYTHWNYFSNMYNYLTVLPHDVLTKVLNIIKSLLIGVSSTIHLTLAIRVYSYP